jgi:serine/threonine protein kinase
MSLIVPGARKGGSRAGIALDGTRMSTFISEPGTRLGGRYRLEDRISASDGWSAWKAIDETLARAVTVLTFAPGFPRIGDAVTAARAASRLTDVRLAQVFDVEENWDQAYVVMEWVAGDSLNDMLADGPLDPGQSAEIIAEGAEALASAHAAGVAHLCLTPGSLRWTSGGGVKVVGLGIDAALSGTTADDPELADTWGLGKLLYAALTAHWPGDGWPALPQAPRSPDGRPCSPRQVLAGVPSAVDDITCQALFQDGRGGGPPLTSPAMLAGALSHVIPAPVAPLPALPQHQAGPEWDETPPGRPYWQQAPEPPRRGPRPAPRRPRGRSRASALMLALGAVLVVALVGIGVWVLGHHHSSTNGSTGPPTHSSSSASSATLLAPVSAHGFDPLSSPSDDPQNENDQLARFAIDSNPSTFWNTQFYVGSPVFGGLKTGTGLILDMGRKVKLASVQVTFGSIPGADVQIKVGNSNVRAPSVMSSFTTVASATDVAGVHTFTVHSSATGQYVLIWFTKLPPQTAGSTSQFEAKIYNVIVRGTH